MTDTKRRAAWALASVVPAPSIGAALAFWLAPGTPLAALGYGAGKLVLYGAPVLWALLHREPWLRFSRPRLRDIGVGLALGSFMILVMLGAHTLWLARVVEAAELREMLGASGFTTRERYVAGFALVALVNAALEEYVFRGFLFARCRELLGPRGPASLLAALLFTAHHVVVLTAFLPPLLALVGSAAVLAAGYVWCRVYLWSGSLWPCYLSHILADVGVGLLGYRLLFAT